MHSSKYPTRPLTQEAFRFSLRFPDLDLDHAPVELDSSPVRLGMRRHADEPNRNLARSVVMHNKSVYTYRARLLEWYVGVLEQKLSDPRKRRHVFGVCQESDDDLNREIQAARHELALYRSSLALAERELLALTWITNAEVDNWSVRLFPVALELIVLAHLSLVDTSYSDKPGWNNKPPPASLLLVLSCFTCPNAPNNPTPADITSWRGGVWALAA